MNKRQRKKRVKKIWPIGSKMYIDPIKKTPVSDGFFNNGKYTFKVKNGTIVEKIDNFYLWILRFRIP